MLTEFQYFKLWNNQNSGQKNHYFGGGISFSWVEVEKLLFNNPSCYTP